MADTPARTIRIPCWMTTLCFERAWPACWPLNPNLK